WFEIANKRNSNANSVAIIGAGIAGLTTAWMLAKQGVQVSVFERAAAVGSGASGNPCGLVMPRFSNDFSTDTQFYYTALLQAAQFYSHLQQTYPELQWVQSGAIQLVSEAQLLKAKATGYPESFVKPLSADEVSELSGLSVKSAGLWFPQSGYLSPQQLCNILYEDLRGDVEFYFNAEIDRLQQQDEQWLLQPDNSNTKVFNAVVLANSFSVNKLLNLEFLNLEKNRGQLSIAEENKSLTGLKMPLVYDAYLTPALNGQHMLGASYAPDEQKSVREKDHQKNLDKLESILGSRVSMKLEELFARISFRAYSQDRMPVIGPVYDEAFYKKEYWDLHHGKRYKNYTTGEYVSDLYINAGHGSRGLVSAIPAAHYLSELIGNKPLTIAKDIRNRVHPARFIIRHLKKQVDRP
ncbi:MAG: FAD-dependent 5-carboxymethylaminomethyl-2-thiouridine(34) oxidoreductase MnmC, partial [Gammaproteobacteria bacterium]|nr:FAD-dependent 5-carboxymethylaminomethyl-2-thiouridine(34) oxidoreductase MnmC [Gammaproteobacteria bacterium]